MTELPDNIPVYGTDGKLVCWRPNYDKPGVFERVQREAFDTECAAHPPRSNVDGLILSGRVARFEALLKERT